MKTKWTKTPSVCRKGKFFYVTKIGEVTYSVSRWFRGPWHISCSLGAAWGEFATKEQAMAAVENGK